MIKYQRAIPANYPEILKVAEPFYPDVEHSDRSRGFLDKRFTTAMLSSINQRLGLLIAEGEKQHVLGFLGLSPFSDGSPSPVVDSMLKTLIHTLSPELLDKPFVFGPVCISKQAAGLGVFKGLYQYMWQYLSPSQYQTGFAFINQDNLHSLNAHTKGLSADIVGEFNHQLSAYFIIRYQRPLDLS
ncbi:hypothetical protein I2494_01140 [Budviciaceae bacterium BWR-B9]|uniref:N-acetyltransferase n=1 Tax=Limnobaculum allomyrinae TaxID=2791986 RepID=A0ABS1IKY0_9GAMM|nr:MULTISPECIES: hypothetical protein [Limnobaculum]MBK5142339.1 hypothetical protein [Limnobaculum allomyrinae]MBV7690776.1 hypothetical protein [Limnobaculum sp. M2-1]